MDDETDPLEGDGFLGYACEDGNLVDGDGCSDNCRFEPGFACVEEASGTVTCTAID